MSLPTLKKSKQICIFSAKYLGDQRFSYNQFFSFDLRIGEEDARPSVVDIVFESGDQRFSSAIFVQGNQMPGITTHNYKFRLNERPSSQWTPRLKAQDFIAVLANLTAVKVRGTYSANGKDNEFSEIKKTIVSPAKHSGT